jgi:flagellar basal-body rod modification protein FlgD
MSTVTAPANSNGTTTATANSVTSQSKALGKDEFFKMLIAQLKNQDPLNPMDGTAFSAQLAQFSSLEQLTNLNAAVTAQNLNFTNLLNAQSVNLIGKEVTAETVDAKTSQTTTLSGEVTAVRFKDAAIYVTVNDKEIAWSDVKSVK